MRKGLLLSIATLLPLACGDEPETHWIRLVDEFDASMVQNSPPLVEPERTEWRFDGEGTVVLEDAGPTQGWSVFNAVAGLDVQGGTLVGTTTEGLSALLATRPDDMDDGDLLYGVEVRMRVSDGSEIGVNLSGDRDLTDEDRERWLENLQEQPRPQLRAELTPGDEFETYLLREAGATIRVGNARNLFVQPTDAAGAEFEIESVRLIPLKQHLASIPSGPGWHGLSEIYRETIVARSPERLSVHVALPDQPWLDLAFGTIEDGPLTFRVSIEAGGTETKLLRRTVTMPDRWIPMRLDLTEFAGQDVTLALELSADEPGMLGYWGGPVIRTSGSMLSNDHVTPDRAALEDQGARRPKAVVLFLGDTLRRDHLSPWGYRRDTAPTLQEMARDGVVFADNIAQASWTKVSVPSLMTSLYPTSHGIVEFADRLPSSVTTLAEAFRAAGYATWQTSSVPFTGKMSNLHQGVGVLHERGSIGELDHSPAKTARTYVDRFLEWARDHHDVPFFAFVHVFDPHSPFEPYAPYDATWGTPEGKEEYERGLELWEGASRDDLPSQAQIDSTDVDQELFLQHEKDWYDGSILGMDVEIARLMEGLEELGIADETLFVFTSDHGEEFLEHGYHFHGNNAYGEMVNVPLVMWWPGVLPAGTRVEQTTENVDMMPTVLELAGIEPPQEVQGQSLLPLILDPESTSDFGAIRRAAFSERVRLTGDDTGMPHDQFAIVLDGWKLVKNENQPDDWPEYELYDHEADPLNLTDVADDHPEIVERLAAELGTWREYALSLRPPPDTEAIEGLSEEEIARLRSLGYIN